MKAQQGGIILGVVLIVLAYSSMFTVSMTENAIVLQLGEHKRTITEPGLYFKLPVLQDAQFFSKQLLVNDGDPAELITKDKKKLLVDNYSMWKIIDPLKFLQTVRREGEAQARLNDLIKAELRVELGIHDLTDVVAITREAIMGDGERRKRSFAYSAPGAKSTLSVIDQGKIPRQQG